MVAGCILILLLVEMVCGGLLACGIYGWLAWRYVAVIFLVFLVAPGVVIRLGARKRSKRQKP